MSGEPEVGVVEAIRRGLGQMPRAERQVGRALLQQSPTIGLESSLRLAEIVGCSGATVIRFVNRLGYGTYAEFQREWRAAIDARLVTPTETYSRYEPETDAMARMKRSVEAAGASIAQSIAQMTPEDLDAAVELIAERRRVLIFGGWFSHVLARHLVALLAGVRPGVMLLEQPPGQRSAALVDTTRRDAAIVFDFRRYEQDTLVAARYLAERKVPIVLVTDQWVSPIAGLASAVLIAHTDAPNPLESLAPPMALVEGLAAAVIDRLGPAVGPRIGLLGEVSAQLIPNWGAGEP